jgi:serine phosphatase RsbU (regulator of sigma subunit)
VLRATGEVDELGVPGDLLGVFPHVESTDAAINLGPGDALILFTDGITERRQGSRFFGDELPALLRRCSGAPAGVLARQIEEAAVSFSPETPDDDMAIVVIAVPATA